MASPFKTKLANGLTVLLQEMHQAPVVSFNLWANVGSVNEADEEAGICHLIEHMIFKGTSTRPVGEIARSVEAAGGDMNAYTSFDETVFYINMPSRNQEIGLEILADAASDPTFDAAELQREKEVVVEEISRAEDNPSQMASEDLFARAFTVHPYRRPIAGTRETVRGISREYLLEFFRRWYVGSNLIFVAVGDFGKDEILSVITRLFSKIPAGGPPKQDLPTEPPQSAPRIATRPMPIEGHYLALGLPIPTIRHPDVAGLDLLAHILGGGTSSRLEQEVKEKKGLVTSIGSTAYTPRYPSLFITGALLKDGRLPEAWAAIRREMEKLRREPPTPVECARARDNLRSVRIYERQTVQGMARKLAFFEGIAGDCAYEEEYYRSLAEVTPEQLQEVACRYLRPEGLTVAFCHPQKEKWDKEKISAFLEGLPAGGAGGSCREGGVTAGKAPRGPFRETVPSPPAGPHPPAGPVASRPAPPLPAVMPTHQFRLPNGIRVLLRENHAVPLISIRSASLGGTRFETGRTNGAFHLISSLLTKGTAHRTAREIAEESDNLSGHVGGYSGRNLIGVEGTFLAEKLTEGLDLFCDLLRFPAFPEEEIGREKAQTITAIRTEEDSLPSLTMKKFLETLYPRHPYGLPVLGTIPSVRRLRRRLLANIYEQTVRPDNLVVSVVGDFSSSDMKERLREKLGSWKGVRRGLPRLPEPLPPRGALTTLLRRKKFQAHIVYGFLGTTFRNRDRYPLEVLNSVLAGQGGRLFLELRDRQGLAYAVSSSTQEGIEPGFITLYMGTDPTKLEAAAAGLKGEIEKIIHAGAGEEELGRARRYIVGNYEMDLQKNANVATLLAFDTIYGVGPGELERYPREIEKVTAADVLRVARRYLRPGASVLSLIRP